MVPHVVKHVLSTDFLLGPDQVNQQHPRVKVGRGGIKPKIVDLFRQVSRNGMGRRGKNVALIFYASDDSGAFLLR